jgi:hypothetical protein
MLRFLASGLRTRNLSRRVARMIPNPLVRTLAIAATGYAVNRAVMGAGRRATTGTPGAKGWSRRGFRPA